MAAQYGNTSIAEEKNPSGGNTTLTEEKNPFGGSNSTLTEGQYEGAIDVDRDWETIMI